MDSSKWVALFAAAGTIAAWLVVPDFRCAVKLHMPAGECRGTGDSPQTPRVDTVVIKTYIQSPPPPPSNPPRPPEVHTTGELPIQMLRLLTEAELEGKSDWELDIMRNEIYARHGRGFDRDDLQRHFGQFSWYRPTYNPQEFDRYHQGRLTEIQRTNAEVIRSYQQSRR
jgi:YARHG domain